MADKVLRCDECRPQGGERMGDRGCTSHRRAEGEAMSADDGSMCPYDGYPCRLHKHGTTRIRDVQECCICAVHKLVSALEARRGA